MDPWITTDWVKIDDPLFVDIKDPKIQGLRFNQDKPETHSVGIELLHPPYSYAARDILAVFAPSNTIPMKYTDDAIVSGAKLQLVQNDPARLYSVKFVCGDSEGEIVSPGRYFTAINVHNPSCTSVRFRYKVALAFPGEPGEVSPFKEVSLGPDQAFEIDCAQVRELIESDQRFLKGFVVIESEHELDVVAVYTAGAPEVRTLHTERVVPRTNRLPDLVPVPDPRPGFGFCRLDDQRQLLITIRNQGSADAGASLTRVTFASGGSKDIPTPPIPAGGSVTLAPVEMPGECFNPNCHFTIIANANGAVIESNMANNIGTGSCLG